jgi:hypothetical protein
MLLLVEINSLQNVILSIYPLSSKGIPSKMPFKNRIREKWESWMLHERIGHESMRPPSREDIAKWALSVLETIPEEIVKNAWTHGDYTWFPDNDE